MDSGFVVRGRSVLDGHLPQGTGFAGEIVIYATDINQKALQTAREGVYHLKKMKGYTSTI